MLGLDNLLLTAIIPHRFARRHDAPHQRRLTDHLPGPQLIEQFVFGDKAVAVVEQVDQDIKDLGLNLDRRACPTQVIELVIKGALPKVIEHSPYSSLSFSAQAIALS
jgi:hypothetical protein